MQKQSTNVVTAEQYGLLEKKLFKNQSIQETKECLSRMFLDIMCSDVSDDTRYRNDIVATVETLTSVLTSIEEKHDPYDTLLLTITYVNL